jgi:hypothetical protein
MEGASLRIVHRDEFALLPHIQKPGVFSTVENAYGRFVTR